MSGPSPKIRIKKVESMRFIVVPNPEASPRVCLTNSKCRSNGSEALDIFYQLLDAFTLSQVKVNFMADESKGSSHGSRPALRQ